MLVARRNLARGLLSILVIVLCLALALPAATAVAQGPDPSADPVYEWHTFYGASTDDRVNGIAVDKNGNVYVAGYSTGVWLGAGGTAPIHPYSGGWDIVVTKFDSTGAYQWHTFYGSAITDSADSGAGIAVDDANNVYVVGTSDKPWLGDGDTPPLHAHSAPAWAYADDIVVLKLDSAGNYQWHTFYGSSGDDAGSSIATSGAGVYVAGTSYNSWLGTGGVPPRHSGGSMVVVKLDSSGAYSWHAFYGWGGEDAFAVAADPGGDVYVAGYSNRSWPGDGGAAPLHPFATPYGDHIAVFKLDAAGAYQWHTFYGRGGDQAYGITVNGAAVYVSGMSMNGWLGDQNAAPLHAHSAPDPSQSNRDMVLMKLDTAGAYQWHTFYGSRADDYAFDVATSSNEVFVSGLSSDAWNGENDADPLHPSTGGSQTSVIKLSDAGMYQWHTFYPSGLFKGAAAGDGRVYLAGTSSENWLAAGDVAPLHGHSGSGDLAALKLDPAPAVWATAPMSGAGGVALDAGIQITFTEAVATDAPAFTLSCTVSGNHTSTFQGAGREYSLAPDASFAFREQCTVGVAAAGVVDGDAVGPSDTMRADYEFAFTTVYPLFLPAVQK